MASPNLAPEIAEARKQFQQLSKLAEQQQPMPPYELLQEAFSELHTTIEELHVAEEELRSQNEQLIASRLLIERERTRYQDLFEFAPDGYVVTNALGMIQEANRAATILLGMRRKYLIGKPLASFIGENDRQAFRQEVNSLRDSEPSTERIVSIKPRISAPFRASYLVSAARDIDGNVVTLRWMLRDITERTHIEAKLLSLNSTYEREHGIAQTFQRSLMQDIPEDSFAGLEITTHYEAALDEAQIGGDFYDAFKLPSGKIALIVGDISGKGLKAAVYTSQVKSILRAYLAENRSLVSTMTRLNRFVSDSQISGDWNSDTFVALSLATIDPTNGNAGFVSAGMEPPILLCADGRTEIINSSGPLVGVDNQASYEETAIMLSNGDAVALVTDGITEARRNGQMLGLDGLLVLAEQAHALKSVTDQREYIMSGARRFLGTACFQDDVCILIARFISMEMNTK